MNPGHRASATLGPESPPRCPFRHRSTHSCLDLASCASLNTRMIDLACSRQASGSVLLACFSPFPAPVSLSSSDRLAMHLKDLKKTAPADLVQLAEELGVEGASTLRKQDLMFAILKAEAENGEQIMGEGTIEVLPDGFGFLRSPEANFLAGPDDIYVSPNQVRRFGLRTGDTVDGEIRAHKDGERYFALVKLNTVNFDDPDVVRHRVNFDNLTPLYPESKLTLDPGDPTQKDKSARVIDIVSPQGKGQRTLIVAPPRVGKTVMLQNIAKAITDNHP
jgi:transcription termination factor Rho